MTTDDLFAVAVLAKRRAKLAVKAALRARGIKLTYVPTSEIVALAREYLIAHRDEVLAQARKEWAEINGLRP